MKTCSFQNKLRAVELLEASFVGSSGNKMCFMYLSLELFALRGKLKQIITTAIII